jgi:hypothetical protein
MCSDRSVKDVSGPYKVANPGLRKKRFGLGYYVVGLSGLRPFSTPSQCVRGSVTRSKPAGAAIFIKKLV